MAKNVKNPSGYHSSGKTIKDKANNFGAFVKQFGWSGSWSVDDKTGNVILFATRGDSDESIEIIWYKTPQSGEPNGEVWYTLAGQNRRCHNVAEAAKIAQEPPNPAKMLGVRSKRQSNGEMTTEEMEALQGSLPFDHESSDEEIKLVLFQKEITWVNRLSGRMRTEIVGGRRHFKVVRRDDKHDYIDFVSVPPRGELPVFYAVHLDSIVSVS
jgi:hypothetical protein